MSEATITLDSADEAVRLFGNRDQNLKLIRTTLGVRLIARGDTVQAFGSDEQVEQVVVKTLEEAPPNADTYWSTRSMAKATACRRPPSPGSGAPSVSSRT